MIDLKAQRPAGRYAEGFFKIIQNKDTEKFLNEIDLILEQIEKNSEFNSFIFHPIVSKEDKKSVINQIFSSFDENTLNFIFLLLDENRLDCLDEIKDVLVSKINEQNCVKQVSITLASDIDDNMKNLIKERLETKLQSKVLPVFHKDEEILGGMILRIKDTLIDLSIKNKIENLKRI